MTPFTGLSVGLTACGQRGWSSHVLDAGVGTLRCLTALGSPRLTCGWARPRGVGEQAGGPAGFASNWVRRQRRHSWRCAFGPASAGVVRQADVGAGGRLVRRGWDVNAVTVAGGDSWSALALWMASGTGWSTTVASDVTGPAAAPRPLPDHCPVAPAAGAGCHACRGSGRAWRKGEVRRLPG